MKRTDRNPWPEKFDREIAITANNEIKNLMGLKLYRYAF